MSEPIKVAVDPTNPGQFFACCGLLELADRLWPGAEGWFERDSFYLRTTGSLRQTLICLILDPPNALLTVCDSLPVKPIVALLALTFDGDATSRFEINFWVKIVTKSGKVEAVAAPPWNMWSGNQKTHTSIWPALRDALRIQLVGDKDQRLDPLTDKQLDNLFRQTRPLTGRFGFDSTAAWNAQDVGFSPNDQGMAVESSPATELLAAVGLQRFRPVIDNGVVQYQLWNNPASPAIAAAFTCGGIQHSGTRYRFEIVNRGQYSAFGKARPMKGDSINA